MNNARFIHLEVNFARLNLRYRPGHIKGHRSQLGVRHQSSGPQNTTEFPNSAHHIRGGNGLIKLKPATLNLLQKFIRPRVIGTGIQGLFFLFPFGKNSHPNFFSNAIGKRHRTSDHLVCMPGVNTQLNR